MKFCTTSPLQLGMTNKCFATPFFSPKKDKIITKKDFKWSKWYEKRKKDLLVLFAKTCFTYITWITRIKCWSNFNSRDASASKNECMNDCRRCKSNAELLKCCFTCMRHIQSAFLHSGISCMYKLYLKCKYLYVDISKCMI